MNEPQAISPRGIGEAIEAARMEGYLRALRDALAIVGSGVSDPAGVIRILAESYESPEVRGV